MNIRQQTERIERETLSKYAFLSENSRGRSKNEEQDDIRTVFQRDRDRIIHSKSFRRLKQKTQVFLSPEGDHFRTRLTHTLEVAQIARTVSRALRLNEDLTEAIALGHDAGHTPYGHAGERALSDKSSFKFNHNEQSVRVLEVLEKSRKGLNLTQEVLDGILNHTGPLLPYTNEGKVVRYADVIAYVNHDIDDAVSAGILDNSDIPKEIIKFLGNSKTARITSLVYAVINGSKNGSVVMEEEYEKAMIALKDFLKVNVYGCESIRREEKTACDMLGYLFDFYMDNPLLLPDENKKYIEIDGKERCVLDYISCMTDQFAYKKYHEVRNGAVI